MKIQEKHTIIETPSGSMGVYTYAPALKGVFPGIMVSDWKKLKSYLSIFICCLCIHLHACNNLMMAQAIHALYHNSV